MILRGQNWPNVYNASGARGFSGEGYPFHKPWRPFGLDYTGSCFVAKTTTLEPRLGNMPLDENLRPRELLPKCIVVKLIQGVVLNAVGLSGPGLSALLARWLASPRQSEPWTVSFMPVAKTALERIEEAAKFFSEVRVLSHRGLMCNATSQEHADGKCLAPVSHAPPAAQATFVAASTWPEPWRTSARDFLAAYFAKDLSLYFAPNDKGRPDRSDPEAIYQNAANRDWRSWSIEVRVLEDLNILDALSTGTLLWWALDPPIEQDMLQDAIAQGTPLGNLYPMLIRLTHKGTPND
jgi:hypothetical protein